jgi:hypothetical protein
MRKVIDCSGLESREFAEFMSDSAANFAILSDVCRMDTFAAGRGAQKILLTLSNYPGRAILLRPTSVIWRMTPRAREGVGRFVNRKDTALFPKYCAHLVAGEKGLLDNLEKKKMEAKTFLAELLPDAEEMRDKLASITGSYETGDLSVLRAERRITDRLCRRIGTDVAHQTAADLRGIFGNGIEWKAADAKYSLPFRIAASFCALGLMRASTGAFRNLKAATFRSDLNDAVYAAYATYYDGLITRDEQLADVYNLTVKLLRSVFDLRRLTAKEIALPFPQ